MNPANITACDLLVVGAGPAGMTAAMTAAQHGADALLVDEQARLGGQIYRNIERNAELHPSWLGPDYFAGAAIASDFRKSSVRYQSQCLVWNIERRANGFRVVADIKGAVRFIDTTLIILATGALERPVPLPGWDLPGVMTAGALQIALKANAAVPAGQIVLAGTGPLLWLLAAQLCAAGAAPAAVVDAAPLKRYLGALAALPQAFRAASYLFKGIDMMRRVRRYKVPVYRGVRDMRIIGEDRAQGVSFRHWNRDVTLPADVVGLHDGIVPSTNAAVACGCETRWDTGQSCFRPQVDRWYRSSAEGISIVGDGSGIFGADVAALAGQVAGLQAASSLDLLEEAERNRMAASLFDEIRAVSSVRPFLERLYAPVVDVARAADSTIICRCEEVTAGRIREAVAAGARSFSQAKSFTRCGMGPCQSRVCGTAVTRLVSAESGLDPDEIGAPKARFPLKPVSVGDLAAIGDDVSELMRT